MKRLTIENGLVNPCLELLDDVVNRPPASGVVVGRAGAVRGGSRLKFN